MDQKLAKPFVEAVHVAAVAAMQSIAAGEPSLRQMQNLRADALALAASADDKIAELGARRVPARS